MKYISTIKITFFIIASIFMASCEDQIATPVADFRIMDAPVLNEIDVDNIKVGETVVFENTGQGLFLTVWTGDRKSAYPAEPEIKGIDTRVRDFTLANGEEIEYESILIERPENTGNVVNTKTGQFSYTYESAGLSGDTTYIVTWIATNVDVHGNSESAIKQISIRVMDNN
ncbi:MAG: hypothetical protein K9H26_17750 [Prolixibacteraceae bacterium]|nr:hypothetical protein [Prolixibacteraceae bacterium]